MYIWIYRSFIYMNCLHLHFKISAFLFCTKLIPPPLVKKQLNISKIGIFYTQLLPYSVKEYRQCQYKLIRNWRVELKLVPKVYNHLINRLFIKLYFLSTEPYRTVRLEIFYKWTPLNTIFHLIQESSPGLTCQLFPMGAR